jgi:hypothetical protein
MKWVGHVAHLTELINRHNSLVPRSKEKSPFRSGRSREKNNIKMDIKREGGRVWA